MRTLRSGSQRFRAAQVGDIVFGPVDLTTAPEDVYAEAHKAESEWPGFIRTLAVLTAEHLAYIDDELWLAGHE